MADCGGVGQKVLFRASWNRIFSLLLSLKFRSAKGSSRHPALMVLVLIKGMRRGRGGGRVSSRCSFSYQGSKSFPADLPQAKRRNLVHVEYLQMIKPMVVGFCWFLVMCVGLENTCTISGKWNEDVESVKYFIFGFCIWCKSRESGGSVSPRFPCVTLVMESFCKCRLEKSCKCGFR